MAEEKVTKVKAPKVDASKVRVDDIKQSQYFKNEDGKKEQLAVYGLADISKTIKESIVSVKDNEVRFLVDNYYQTQKYRLSVEGQMRSIMQQFDGEGTETPLSLSWTLQNIKNQEQQLKKMLEYYSDINPVCRWAKSVVGIGPVISSSLYAYFDVRKCTSAGEFWSYAGLNDNNNPWLGKEKATTIVNGIINNRNARCKKIDNFIKKSDLDEFDKDLFKTKYTFNEYDLEIDIIEEKNNSLNALKKHLDFDEIFIEYDEDGTQIPYTHEDMVNYIVWLYSPNIITTNIVTEISKILNNRRKSSTIARYSVDTNESSKYYGLMTKEKCISYLSKPPYNTDLKVMMFKIGESFTKQCNKPNSLYGRLFKERKAYEMEKNKNLDYKDQALLKAEKIGKNTDAYSWYSKGMLPPAHINRRAQRYATKLFISHFFECMYLYYYGVEAPIPYVIDHMGHVDYIEPEIPYLDYINPGDGKRREME